MIDFNEAIEVAMDNAKSLIVGARNIGLEGVLLSDNGKLYEVSLSYDLQGKDPLEPQLSDSSGNSNLSQLVKIMSYRKQYKDFLVDSNTGEFRGFKKSRDR
jgi:hypothetical protein